MTKGSHRQVPDTSRVLLDQIMSRFGGDWDIQLTEDPVVWTAIRRPSPTAQHIIVAHDLSQLRTKLEAEL